MSSGLKHILDSNWRGMLSQPVSVVVATISTCPACTIWCDELESWAKSNGRDISVGKVVLDDPGTRRFKQENEWLDEAPGIPFTAIFRAGELQATFAGGGIDRLERRLRRLDGSEDRGAVFSPPQNANRGADASHNAP
jgi:hypothetical protein